MTKTPGPVVGAILALGVVATMLTVESVQSSFPAGLALAAAGVVAAVGCWRGAVFAHGMAVTLGALLMLTGLLLVERTDVLSRLAGVQSYGMFVLALGAAVVGLLVVPASSREWFFAREG